MLLVKESWLIAAEWESRKLSQQQTEKYRRNKLFSHLSNGGWTLTVQQIFQPDSLSFVVEIECHNPLSYLASEENKTHPFKHVLGNTQALLGDMINKSSTFPFGLFKFLNRSFTVMCPKTSIKRRLLKTINIDSLSLEPKGTWNIPRGVLLDKPMSVKYIKDRKTLVVMFTGPAYINADAFEQADRVKTHLIKHCI